MRALLLVVALAWSAAAEAQVLLKGDVLLRMGAEGGGANFHNEDRMAQQPYPSEETWWPIFDEEVGDRYRQVGRIYPDPNDPACLTWGRRCAYDICGGMTKEAAMSKHLKDLEKALGISEPQQPPDPPTPPGPGHVKPLVGYTRTYGRGFGDDSGPRILYGCSDFGALAKHHEDRDKSLRQLDVIAKHQQYVRVLWRLNGWHWTPSGLTVDPIRDPWFEETLFDYLVACSQRGLRVNLTSGDMFNWSKADAEKWFRRVAEISALVDQWTVWLQAVTNEMKGTMPGGESDENVQFCAHLLEVVQKAYPWNHRAVSDPGSQDKMGMRRLTPSPANCSLVHNTRQGVHDAIRRAFNLQYENQPGFPVVEDEPTGLNGKVPYPDGQRVYQPVSTPMDVFAIYTMNVLAGTALTGFNDASLTSREPHESIYGLTEPPKVWHEDMHIPENIAEGTLAPGHKADAPLDVINSGAERADSVVLGELAFGVVSGGSDWRVPCRWDCDATWFGPFGTLGTKRVSAGEPLITSTGPREPFVYRLDRH